MDYTFYFESKFRAWGRSVKYLKFQLPDGTEFILSEEWRVSSRKNKRTGMQRLIFLKRNNYANLYRVIVEVSSAYNRASGKVVVGRRTNLERMSIIILLEEFKQLRYPVHQVVTLEEVEICERFLEDILMYKVTVTPLDESQNVNEITSKRDKILIFSDQLNSLLNTGDFADIIITDDKGSCTIKAHRNILAARSAYFRYMFQNNWKENVENRIVFYELEMGVIKDMLHYIYTGVVRPMKVSDMLYLYMTSDMFLLDDLKEFLSEELRMRLNIQNAVLTYILAGCVLDTDLKQSSLDLIRSNFGRVCNTQVWRALQNNEEEYSLIPDIAETKRYLSSLTVQVAEN